MCLCVCVWGGGMLMRFFKCLYFFSYNLCSLKQLWSTFPYLSTELATIFFHLFGYAHNWCFARLSDICVAIVPAMWGPAAVSESSLLCSPYSMFLWLMTGFKFQSRCFFPWFAVASLGYLKVTNKVLFIPVSLGGPRITEGPFVCASSLYQGNLVFSCHQPRGHI